LWDINTLGFRGEALASIISIAKVICTTRTADLPTGTRVECENSQVKTSETGCAVGTIMEVKNLFYNTPVRLKFLKKAQTEFAYILEIMQGIAISHPNVAITLLNKNHTSLKTTGSNDLGTVISEVYSNDLIRELAKIDKSDELSGLHINGYGSNPDFTRSNKKAIYLFVNGRTVKCPILLKAIDTAYKDMIPNGRYPFVVINLTVPPGDVDVNVHPSKREVRYINPNQIYNFVYSAIKEALDHTPARPQPELIPFQDDYSEPVPVAYKEIKESEIYEKPAGYTRVQPDVSFNDMRLQIQQSSNLYKPLEKQVTLALEDSQNDDILQKPDIIGQLHNTYILVQTDEGLQLIDQHIAHERYLYEKLKESTSFASQLSFTSEVIELEPSEISLIMENKEILEKYGYSIEPVNDKEVIFRQVPQMLANKNPEKIIHELLEALNSSIDTLEDKILMTTACHASVKAGEKLSIWQMEELISNWQKTKFPKTCPHGRKIAHTIPIKDIAAFFSRQLAD